MHPPRNSAPLRVLVTGGAGFIGSHVAQAYVAAGHEVQIIDNLSSGRRENVPPEAELHELDIRSEEAAELIRREGIQILSHHAAQMDIRRSTEDPRYDADVNILGMLNLLEACIGAGTRQVIFASTGGAIYGEQDEFPADESHPARPVSPYGVSKLAGERYLYYYHHQHGLNVTCLRYANVYGERQNPHGEAGVVAIFLKLLLAGERPTINGNGEQTRDYVYVGDVVSANLASLGRSGFSTYNIGTARETSVKTIFETLAQAVGTDLEPSHGPPKPGEQSRSCISPALAQRELGIGSPSTLVSGAQRTADWFRLRSGTGS